MSIKYYFAYLKLILLIYFYYINLLKKANYYYYINIYYSFSITVNNTSIFIKNTSSIFNKLILKK